MAEMESMPAAAAKLCFYLLHAVDYILLSDERRGRGLRREKGRKSILTLFSTIETKERDRQKRTATRFSLLLLLSFLSGTFSPETEKETDTRDDERH